MYLNEDRDEHSGRIHEKDSLSNGKTKQRSGRCPRDVRFPFPNEENGYFPFPGDERKVALQIWVWERTVVEVKITGDQNLVSSNTYESIEYLRWRDPWQEECVFDVNIRGIDYIPTGR